MPCWVNGMSISVEQIKKEIAALRNNGEITKDDTNRRLLEFFLQNSLTSLNSAKVLSKVSLNPETKRQFEFIAVPRFLEVPKAYIPQN